MNDHAATTVHRPSLLPAIVAGVTMTSVLVIVVASLLVAGDVPDAIATRWGPDGQPVDTLPLWGLTLLLAGITTGEGILLGIMSRRVGPPAAQRLLTGVAMGIPPAIAVLHVGTVLAAVDQGTDARLPGTAGLVALVVLAAMVALGYRLAEPVEQQDRLLEPSALEVAPGEAVVWTGRAVAPAWLWAVLGVATAVAVPLVWTLAPVLALVVLAVLAFGASMLVARVTVGPRGLAVRLGPGGLVRLRVPLARVTAADAIVVDPLAHGGYGLRLMPGLRGVIFGAGPGLRVEQEDGPTTVVTITDAAEAAGVLRAHLAAADRT